MARSLPPPTWKHGFRTPVVAGGSEGTTPPWADERYFIDENGKMAHNLVADAGPKPAAVTGNAFGVFQIRTGPFGLEVAMVLARQGVKFRFIDKAEASCLSGRSNGLHPCAIEYLQSWGLGTEFAAEGPQHQSSVLYRSGIKLFHGGSMTCDSRHKVLVERCVTVDRFQVEDGEGKEYPVLVTLKDLRTGKSEDVRSKYIVGGDGAASKLREMARIPLNGLATDCFWAIVDCEFKTDSLHIRTLSMIVSPEHGGTILIPREDGHTRFYIQMTGEKGAKLAQSRKRKRDAENQSAVGDMQITDHGITPSEALEQLNKIMAPWAVEYATTLSWFAVWKINERVAHSLSSSNQRIHIGAHSAHVHSVLGAFGMNSSIYDAANLGWKLDMSAKGLAKPSVLLPTYDSERRLYANLVVRVSGAWLRFICNLNLPLAELRRSGEELETHDEDLPLLDGTAEADRRNSMFMLGVDGSTVSSAICPPLKEDSKEALPPPTSLLNGGVVREKILRFAEVDDLIEEASMEESLVATGPSLNVKDMLTLSSVVYDDRAPDDDAHCWYGINHARGAVVVVRPDLMVGMSVWPEDAREIGEYFDGFLVPTAGWKGVEA
ncbi:FAD binding domain-containing protein [Podospora didyma]|uniref:FAD binding domain-containing protein n=1 Tax=Podospora didyma TaxID=330526 RepID=A0AAE0K289_9PEZI|nr:FAD binding domain-containing protein [Podospora didyma]